MRTAAPCKNSHAVLNLSTGNPRLHAPGNIAELVRAHLSAALVCPMLNPLDNATLNPRLSSTSPFWEGKRAAYLGCYSFFFPVLMGLQCWRHTGLLQCAQVGSHPLRPRTLLQAWNPPNSHAPWGPSLVVDTWAFWGL